jgi:hypothetical protein
VQKASTSKIGLRDARRAKTWPDDRAIGLLLRAAVSPMQLTPGGPLATIAYHFVASLQGVSAAASLIAKSLALRFDGAAQISVPALTLPRGGFIQQAAPIPSSAAHHRLAC